MTLSCVGTCYEAVVVASVAEVRWRSRGRGPFMSLDAPTLTQGTLSRQRVVAWNTRQPSLLTQSLLVEDCPRANEQVVVPVQCLFLDPEEPFRGTQICGQVSHRTDSGH